ncbi:MAG TPA: HAMP domain-containing sensor histidine kinase [Ktedonobacteraceae bacterium]|nr:HAMP domain-containing sensor histidine kinase [Ktedonobacteraceae bacterium]
MQGQREQSQEATIEELQSQINELTAENLLLKEQLARKEQFLAMIAHELRSPLTPIINYAQMIARSIHSHENTPPRTATLQRNTSVIISQARRLSRLVNDLLDASRLSSGQFTLKRENCDIVALAQESIEQLRPLAPYHTLVLAAPDTAVIGNWDSGRLQQALGNLLDNAIKYSDENTTVTVHIATTPCTVHVSVHNQGISIPSTDISLLFRPYTRLPATSTRQGSGLGLFITKSIIETHGGTLRYESSSDEAIDNISQGTTFSFDLPFLADSLSEASCESSVGWLNNKPLS